MVRAAVAIGSHSACDNARSRHRPTIQGSSIVTVRQPEARVFSQVHGLTAARARRDGRGFDALIETPRRCGISRRRFGFRPPARFFRQLERRNQSLLSRRTHIMTGSRVFPVGIMETMETREFRADNRSRPDSPAPPGSLVIVHARRRGLARRDRNAVGSTPASRSDRSRTAAIIALWSARASRTAAARPLLGHPWRVLIGSAQRRP